MATEKDYYKVINSNAVVGSMLGTQTAVAAAFIALAANLIFGKVIHHREFCLPMVILIFLIAMFGNFCGALLGALIGFVRVLLERYAPNAFATSITLPLVRTIVTGVSASACVFLLFEFRLLSDIFRLDDSLAIIHAIVLSGISGLAIAHFFQKHVLPLKIE